MILSVIDVMKVCEGFVRPLRCAEELLDSEMVVSVGLKEKKDDVVYVEALVLRTSGINSKPPAVVKIWADMSKDYGERVIRDNEEEIRRDCDCPAGASEKCKHVMAVLLYLSRVKEDDLADLSCTDIEQQWGSMKKATLQEYEGTKLSELCHVKDQRDIYVNNIPKITKDMLGRWGKKLVNYAVLSEYSLFTCYLRQGQGTSEYEKDADVVGAPDPVEQSLLSKLLISRTWMVMTIVRKWTERALEECTPELIKFYEEHVQVTLDGSMTLISAIQGSDFWKKSRKIRLTASVARAQYTYYVNSKPDWVARYKDVYESTFRGNVDTVRGNDFEPVARASYESQFNCTVLESGTIVRPELPWLSASLDGSVLDENRDIERNIEIKTVKAGTRLTASELVEMDAIPTIDRNGNVKVKTQHYAQMQLGMFLSGVPECDYLVYSVLGKDFVLKRVTFDPEHVLELCSRLVKVYFNIFLPKMMEAYNV